ncbi:MAG: hypothetical protein KDB14_32200, partial [Planctomycetales bacterium]|nr:hypothetical protein [Planctomycetales bacterium]
LAARDRACAAQAMWLLEQRGVDPGSDAVFKLASEAGAEVRAGLLQYLEARRRSLLAGNARP